MSKKQLNIPAIYDESKVDQIRRIAYNDIAQKARQWAKDNAIKPAASDKVKVAVLGIDMQNTFCTPGGELFVQGAVEDSKRFVEFIYRNMNYISKLAMTLDTHTAEQIFHEEFFVNDDGEHPAPMTMISIKDIEDGIWKVCPSVAANIANGNYIAVQNHVMHYVKELKSKGRYDLLIWPYHAILGGVGHALVPAIEEACFFYDRARNNQTKFEVKGGNPLTENYSVFGAEVLTTSGGKPIAQKNTSFIKLLLDYDYVVIGGQAKSHCVAWTIEDLLTEIQARDPKLAKKVYLLEDCTSPVVVPGIVDYTDEANEAFKKFEKAGMHIVKSTDAIENWPGIILD
ncbi:MAG: isochorismatase [Candidatus Gracilibacteria bacterium]|nr:isochorismatase [Candidatus Gracilibacteria bacterium]